MAFGLWANLRVLSKGRHHHHQELKLLYPKIENCRKGSPCTYLMLIFILFYLIIFMGLVHQTVSVGFSITFSQVSKMVKNQHSAKKRIEIERKENQ